MQCEVIRVPGLSKRKLSMPMATLSQPPPISQSPVSQAPLRLAGNSVTAFAAVLLVCWLIAAIKYQFFSIDVGAVIVFFLGRSTAGGSRRAAQWSLWLSAFYLFAAVVVLLALWLRPESVRFMRRPIPSEIIPWGMVFAAVMGVWAAVNISLLYRARRSDHSPG